MPIDLIRRPARSSNEHTAEPARRLRPASLRRRPSLRILLSDTAAEITNLPTVTSTPPMPLDGDRTQRLPTTERPTVRSTPRILRLPLVARSTVRDHAVTATSPPGARDDSGVMSTIPFLPVADGHLQSSVRRPRSTARASRRSSAGAVTVVRRRTETRWWVPLSRRRTAVSATPFGRRRRGQHDVLTVATSAALAPCVLRAVLGCPRRTGLITARDTTSSHAASPDARTRRRRPPTRSVSTRRNRSRRR